MYDNAYNPNPDADDDRESKINAGFNLTNPTINPHLGILNIGTIETYERM